MKAIVFAAGLGSRLRPVTETIPKALVPVNGKPLLEHVVLKLRSAGVEEIIINTHHFPDQIIDFVRSENNFNIRIEFSDERDTLLDTGGGIKKAAWFFDDGKPFIAHNVDILSTVDLKEFYRYHANSGALTSLFVSERKTSRYLLFDEDNRLRAWKNVNTGETKPSGVSTEGLNNMAFNGIHVISPLLFEFMKDKEGKFSIIDLYLSICNQAMIQAFNPGNTKTLDVGKIDSLKEAENFI